MTIRSDRDVALEAIADNRRLRDALRRITQELGVPGPDYPAPVGNAYDIAVEALGPPSELSRDMGDA